MFDMPQNETKPSTTTHAHTYTHPQTRTRTPHIYVYIYIYIYIYIQALLAGASEYAHGITAEDYDTPKRPQQVSLV